MATSFAAAAALPLGTLPPFALASARAAFLAATSASCSAVISGRPALPGAFFSSSLSAIFVPVRNPLRGLEHRSALHADTALLLTFLVFSLRAAGSDALAAPERDVRRLDRAFLLQDAAARVALRRLGV